MRKHVLLYGLVGGTLIAALKLIEYRWLVVEHSVEKAKKSGATEFWTWTRRGRSRNSSL